MFRLTYNVYCTFFFIVVSRARGGTIFALLLLLPILYEIKHYRDEQFHSRLELTCIVDTRFIFIIMPNNLS